MGKGQVYYVHLGNRGWFPPNDVSPTPGWGLANTGPFLNLRPEWYWTGRPLGSSYAWLFDFGDGLQDNVYQSDDFRAWVVHPGEIPVPAALPLFASAVAVVLARAGWR